MSTLQDPIPRPSEQPPEVDYLQNRQNDYRIDRVAFDTEKQQFVPRTRALTVRQFSFDLQPKERELRVIRTAEGFTNAVKRLKKKRGKEKEISNFSFDDAHDWQEINRIVKSAETRYVGDGSTSGKIREFFRKIGDNGKSIQPFVGLLPDGSYKTLCGGLTLILTAMISHSEIREKMEELMEELPDDIKECEDYMSIYSRSFELRQCVEELYVNLLAALEDFVNWYMQGTAKHIIYGLLKNQNYGKSIDNRIQHIKKSRDRFQKVIQTFSHRRQQLTHEVALRTCEGVTKLEDAAKMATKGGQEVAQAVMRRLSGFETQLFNGLQIVLADYMKNASWRKKVDMLIEERDKDEVTTRMRDQLTKASYTPMSLAEATGLDLVEDGYPDDVDSACSNGLTESPKFQDRARWVAESSEFISWIKVDSSEVLVIQGGCSEQEYLSPMSFLVALLHAKLVESDNVLVLSFFCGLHTGGRFDDSEELSGPLLMARALLAQILSIQTVDWAKGSAGLPFLSLKPNEVKKLKRGSFSAYIKLVGKLMKALRSYYAAIFVIIDGIDYYDLHWETEVKQMLKIFLRIASADVEESDGVLKVLFVAATHTNGWPKGEKNAFVLDVPDEVDGEGDALDDLEWE